MCLAWHISSFRYLFLKTHFFGHFIVIKTNIITICQMVLSTSNSKFGMFEKVETSQSYLDFINILGMISQN